MYILHLLACEYIWYVAYMVILPANYSTFGKYLWHSNTKKEPDSFNHAILIIEAINGKWGK